MRTPYSSWRLSLLTVLSLLLHTGRRVRATTTDFYNVCSISNDDIQAGQGSGTLGFGEDSRERCQRVVVSDDAFFIEFTVSSADGAGSRWGHRVEIFDGGYESSSSQRRHVFDSDSAEAGFNVTGNVALVRFVWEDKSASKVNVNFITHRVSQTPACPCPAVHDGNINCVSNTSSQGHRLKHCTLSCNSDDINPALPKASSGDIQCDLNANTWRGVEKTPLKDEYWCIKRAAPQALQKILRFRYTDILCEQLTDQSLQLIEDEVVRYMVHNNSQFSMYGECFVSQEMPAGCSVQRVQIICKSNQSNPSTGLEVVEVIVRDKPKTAKDVWMNVESLATLLYHLSLEDLGKMGRLDVEQNGSVYKVDKFTIHDIPSVDCDCPGGLNKFCALSTHYCAACPRFMYYNPRLQRCSDCFKGQVQDPEDPEKCVPGLQNFTTASLDHCTTSCPPGQGFSYETGLCHWCARDSYSDSNSTNKQQCLKCPVGKVTAFMGAKTASDCRSPCGLGEHVELDHDRFVACQKCPKGHYMDESAHTIQFCKQCRKDYTTSQNGSTSVAQCIRNCPLGNYYNATDASCMKCAKDTFQDEEGSTSCKSCPEGHGTLNSGTTKSGDCHEFCDAGEYFDTLQVACSACHENSYMEDTRHLSISCTLCPDSKTTQDTGSKSLSDCGYYCPAGSHFDSSAKQCKKCEYGFYKSQPGQSQCTPCGDGKTTRQEGAVAETDCVQACGPGTFMHSTDTSCITCPVGTYQALEAHAKEECDKCPAKETTPEQGTKDASKCVKFCELEVERCMYNTECVNQDKDFSCICRDGLEGKRCEVIVDEDKTESISVSIQFTGLEWSPRMADPDSDEHKSTVKKIASSITQELKTDPLFKVVKVNKLSKGSVVAENEIIYIPDKELRSPVEELYKNIKESGKVGSIEVNPSSVQVVGQSCRAPLGMESRAIEDSQITGSQGVADYPPHQARLNIGKGWHAAEGEGTYFLEVKFNEIMAVSEVQTQGKAADSFVTSYKLQYSEDGVSWKIYAESGADKVFDRNAEKETVATHTLTRPIRAQMIKILPLTWTGCVCMRIELLGCRPDDSLLHSGPSPTTPSLSTADPQFLKPTRKRSTEMVSIVLAGIGAFLVVVLCSVVCYCIQTRQIGRSKGHHQMHKIHETTDLEGADGTTYTPLEPKPDEAETIM